jgi:hypothetical protein
MRDARQCPHARPGRCDMGCHNVYCRNHRMNDCLFTGIHIQFMATNNCFQFCIRRSVNDESI